MSQRSLKRFFTPQLLEVVRYTIGCGFSLVLKVALTTFISYLGLVFWLAYLIAISLLLFCSFFYHHTFTFRKKFSGFPQLVRDFRDFFVAVAALKILDYFLVNAGVLILDKLCPEDMSALSRQLLNGAIIICISGSIFVLRYFIYHILFKKAPLEYYTGEVKKVYLTHAANDLVSANAASGGTVTALLLSLLKQKQIDGALVTVSDFSLPPEQRFHTIIARNEKELLQSQGSIYSDFRYLTAETLEHLRAFPGKLAVVGLPCQLRQIDGIIQKNPDIANKIILKIGLFCGHTSKPELLEQVLKKKDVAESSIRFFRFRIGKWRGKTQIVLKNGKTIQWPSAFYNLYQNLFVSAPARCMHCFDHFAEQADISTGDIWCQKYRFAAVKPSVTAIRTEQGEHCFKVAADAGDIVAREKSLKDLFKANCRSAIFHKAVAAKSIVLKKYGISIPVPEGVRPARWNEILAARIIAAFYTAETKDVLKKNRRLLKLYLYIMKGLTSF